MSNVNLPVEWDQSLIEKYNYSGPRYTSYPTALEFNEAFTEQQFLTETNHYPDRALSLYIHIPFCHKLCYFCGCNKMITRQTDKVTRYLDILEQEIIQRAKLFKNRTVTQMHWGGGTPTFLNKFEIDRLMKALRENFNFAADAELSLEVDPREIDLSMVDHLAHVGFNRLSIGIQDFNKEVQKLVNREQDEKFITSLIERAKQQKFQSINLDLIYGLPKQTVESFMYTLQKVAELSPDRLSVFNYAHLPQRFAAQRKIKDHDLPTAPEKLKILQETIKFLTQSGYQFIGMDHFAKPTDELALAQKEGILHRNFQGYTTQGNNDLLGLGVSAISMLGDCYSQNQKELSVYEAEVTKQGHALWKGFVMNEDDKIRRDVIKQLICHFSLDKSQIEKLHNIHFDEYFAEDLQLLNPLVQDKLINLTETSLEVTPKGRLLIRNICMCFDVYLRRLARQQQFSRVI
ncbi:oxygen-independent coproporphyrinogen III oxidase [Zophobihabitans entericus]|uniref:Coproporphyrinogen-III oxidase n=1 Tax=Zophobihabitans entericus TaxID=1635327 RepID=A0A6G9IBW9_9GAMM|nr:oxygen-independent coproporphyrinogen III oxidase [Zophobihabitans entericus]QIQ21725.1 oxygen-independent coproporphyrinogen III oxidase [Zophobihabitans entericus]